MKGSGDGLGGPGRLGRESGEVLGSILEGFGKDFGRILEGFLVMLGCFLVYFFYMFLTSVLGSIWSRFERGFGVFLLIFEPKTWPMLLSCKSIKIIEKPKENQCFL